MPTEIFFYRDSNGACPVQEFFDRLSHKELVRCLSQIDLLEGDDLPAEVDHEVVDTPLRVLTARTGRSRYRFTYARHDDQAILIDANQGKLRKSLRADRDLIQEAIETIQAGEPIAPERLKSHREYVAELTINDPAIAAVYSRARERALFAVSVIRLRIAAGYTTDSLAERTGLSLRRVESLERGRMPKLSTMRRLAEALQARIVISPGNGITIEPYAEPKRSGKPRRAAAGLENQGKA